MADRPGQNRRASSVPQSWDSPKWAPRARPAEALEAAQSRLEVLVQLDFLTVPEHRPAGPSQLGATEHRPLADPTPQAAQPLFPADSAVHPLAGRQPEP